MHHQYRQEKIIYFGRPLHRHRAGIALAHARHAVRHLTLAGYAGAAMASCRREAAPRASM